MQRLWIVLVAATLLAMAGQARADDDELTKLQDEWKAAHLKWTEAEKKAEEGGRDPDFSTHPAGAFRPRFREAAKKYAGKPAVIPILIWLTTNSDPSGGDSEANRDARWAVERLTCDHAADPAIKAHLPLLNEPGLAVGTDLLVAFYEQIIDANKDKEARADAMLSLAMLHQRESEGSDDEEDPRPPNKARSTMALKLLHRLEEEYADTPAAARARDCLYEVRSLQVGMKAPEIQGRDAEGREIKLSQFAGQVVVLDFWGTWSRECRRMIPQKREMAAKLRKSPFVLLGINSEEDPSALARIIKRERINWPNIYDGPLGKGEIARRWNVMGCPTIYVIDQDGVIRYRNVRGKRLDLAVEELIKNGPGKKQ